MPAAAADVVAVDLDGHRDSKLGAGVLNSPVTHDTYAMHVHFHQQIPVSNSCAKFCTHQNVTDTKTASEDCVLAAAGICLVLLWIDVGGVHHSPAIASHTIDPPHFNLSLAAPAHLRGVHGSPLAVCLAAQQQRPGDRGCTECVPVCR